MIEIPIVFTLLIILVISLLIILTIKLYKLSKQHRTAYQQLNNQMQNQVQAQFQAWRERECESIRTQQRDIAFREANTQLQQWRYESEVLIRNDAIQRSQSVIIGKVTEHLIPYMPKFAFNPKDVRFIGSPIDLIIFDGMDEGDVQEVVFVEVKTGASASLTKRERQIRNIIQQGKVKWIEMRIERES